MRQTFEKRTVIYFSLTKGLDRASQPLGNITFVLYTAISHIIKVYIKIKSWRNEESSIKNLHIERKCD